MPIANARTTTSHHHHVRVLRNIEEDLARSKQQKDTLLFWTLCVFVRKSRLLSSHSPPVSLDDDDALYDGTQTHVAASAVYCLEEDLDFLPSRTCQKVLLLAPLFFSHSSSREESDMSMCSAAATNISSSGEVFFEAGGLEIIMGGLVIAEAEAFTLLLSSHEELSLNG